MASVHATRAAMNCCWPSKWPTSSSRHDLTTKRDLYARAGAPVYWVLDIVGRRLIAHRLPVNGRYEEVQTVQEDGTISLDGQQLAIARLLPPALA